MAVADRILGMKTEELFADMGKTWEWLMADSQLRWYNLQIRRCRLSMIMRIGSALRRG
jgi:hypothetical protein